ncbi:MAG: oleate hydratase [Terracidiphilus sp.]
MAQVNGKNHLMARSDRRAYLVGGGIASLASAAYLIREGGIPGGARPHSRRDWRTRR